MKNCSKYIIKVDYAVSMKKDNGAENRKRATEKFEFEKILIEKFSGVSLDYIVPNEQVEVIEFIKSIQPKWFSTVKKI
jgi:hypothetical protein